MKILKILILLCFPLISWSHPHIFITASMQLTVTEQQQLQVDIKWSFDAMTSQGFIQQFDLDHDRQFSPDEVSVIQASAFETLRSYDYFHPIKDSQGSLIPFSVKDFRAWIDENDSLIFGFSITDPIILDGQPSVTIGCSDPESYVYMQIEEKGIQMENRSSRQIVAKRLANSNAKYYGYTVKIENRDQH